MGKTWAELFEETFYHFNNGYYTKSERLDMLCAFLGKVSVTLDLLTAENDELKRQVTTLKHWFDLKEHANDEAQEA